jgi:hypothetical protein
LLDDKAGNERSHQGRPAANPALPRLPLSSLWTVLAILVALAGALSAAQRLLTRFAVWDDEGYMLVSLAHYINEGHLYTRTFSQYGPFFFYAQGIFFQLLHFPVTHDMGRLVTLVYWVASSLLAAVFVQRLSRSMFLSCAAGLCCMLAGSVLANEPGHPQQLVLLLCMLAASLSLPSLSGRYALRLFLLGCVGAALVFTKVNVGVFYVAALAHALVCLLPSGRIRSIGIGLTLLYAAAFPWLLMHSNFNHGFRGYFFLATVGGIVTFAFGALIQPQNARPQNRLPIRAVLWSAAGLLTGTVLIVVATSLQGMSLGSLVLGVILNPLHHPGIFQIQLGISRVNLLAAVILTAGVVGLRLWARRLAESRWLDVLTCAAGIGSILLLTMPHRIQWVVPLLPLTLIPRPRWDRDAGALFSRLFITCMAVTQFLQPYPVAGSQTGIAAAPMILWAFLCIADGIAGLRTSSCPASLRLWEGLRLDVVIGSAILVLFAGIGINLAVNKPLPPASGLRGSAWLHLPVEQAAGFESIAGNVSANCSTLFTMPGMASLNLWSGVPTPNGWNLTVWMKGISSEGQEEILRLLKSDSRDCAILNRSVMAFWGEDKASVAALPLARYIMTEMPKVTEIDGYEIHVHPNRSASWSQSP